ncbi:hypothetical protein [Dyella telluris]|uniref:Uncharacterized protein n=1 Tax=Dyella telluris TaxID=2763498 RepID=A0A7G8Q9K4_9GAMM|nr:hypothetical protein [Dyella telluris]QNK03462.1 hypothetical protein H8F01_10295 [Dyella telluris]
MRVFKGLLWATGAVLVALMAAFAWGRLRPPTPAQERALALLNQDLKPATGRNANAWLWFMGFDIPADQVDAAYAKQRQRMVAWVQSFRPGDATVTPPATQADFPKLPSMSSAERQALCKPRDADCLAKVRTHRDEIVALLARHEKLLARDKALGGFDYLWSDMPEGPLTPMPPFAIGMGLWQTSIAADFADGRQAQAMDAACLQVASMRRLHAHANSLVGTMIFAVRLRGGVRLFAELLKDFPASQSLPSSCAEAFAPVMAEDVDLCPSMQAEFAMVASPQLFGRPEHWYENLSWSSVHSQRLLAPGYSAMCEPRLTQRLLADEHVELAKQPPRVDLFDFVSNSAGTILSRISGPAFDVYLARQQDTAASLRMGALLIWMRDTPGDGTSPAQRYAQRPAWIHFAESRRVGFSADGRSLTMDVLDVADQRNYPWPTMWALPPEH